MRKILIVEDEDILREAYEMILSTEPYTIHTAGNGQEALEKSQVTQYDLILLDIMMPIMSGVEYLDKIRDLDIGSPRIILLTNLSSGKEIDFAISLGAHGKILKASLSPKELLSAVRYQVEAI